MRLVTSISKKVHTFIRILFGTTFTSVTTFLRRFSEEKTEEEWNETALNCIKSKEKKNEKYNGMTVKQVRDMWSASGEYARKLGTEIHSVMENLWYRKDYNGNRALMSQYEGMEQDFDERKVYCKSLYNKMRKMYVPIKNEFIVYDVDNALCGTIDFLAYNKVKKCYSIIDWKTSKSFDSTNPKNEKLLAPFTDFDACNVNEYSIQLSTYAYILEKHTSIRIGEMVLFQIPKASTAPTICVCNDMRPYLKTILK